MYVCAYGSVDPLYQISTGAGEDHGIDQNPELTEISLRFHHIFPYP
jgi:hypothetical protein